MDVSELTVCPACGDGRLRFNREPVGSIDEGDLWVCTGCGSTGETVDLVPPSRPRAYGVGRDGGMA